MGPEEPRPGPILPQPPRRPWGNLTAELGRFRGTVQDLERHLRAHSYPLRANQTYTSVARHIHEYLQRRLAASAPTSSPASPPRRPYPTASPDSGTRKRDSNQGIYGLLPEGVDGMVVPRHPKPEVLGSSANGSLLVSLDGLRGHFEQVVLRWQPQPPADAPRGELTVPGTTRTVTLPDLRPATTYHVEVHGVRAGQTSKSYAFITTTGSVGWGAGPPLPCPGSPVCGVPIPQLLPLLAAQTAAPSHPSAFKSYLVPAPGVPRSKAQPSCVPRTTSTPRVLAGMQGPGDWSLGSLGFHLGSQGTSAGMAVLGHRRCAWWAGRDCKLTGPVLSGRARHQRSPALTHWGQGG